MPITNNDNDSLLNTNDVPRTNIRKEMQLLQTSSVIKSQSNDLVFLNAPPPSEKQTVFHLSLSTCR